MNEIGGYIELDELISNEYYPDLIALNTARNALVYLVRSKGIEKIYIPYFLCDSVSNVCTRENIPFEYYHIDKNFEPIFERELKENEFLYIVNFYGQLTEERINALKIKHQHIIVDNVQAFFDSPIGNIPTIYSCRKFFGVPDGAYLSCDSDRLELETDVSMNRMKHILGRFEGNSASDYYSDFQSNDALFDELPLRYMSKLTHNVLGAIDYNRVMEKRNSNWTLLHILLGEKNKLELNKPNGPYMYPFLCDNGAAVRKKLAEKKIYIPTLWPNVLDFNGCELEKDYAVNILPLPIDQRYGETEMKQMVFELLRILEL